METDTDENHHRDGDRQYHFLENKKGGQTIGKDGFAKSSLLNWLEDKASEHMQEKLNYKASTWRSASAPMVIEEGDNDDADEVIMQ